MFLNIFTLAIRVTYSSLKPSGDIPQNLLSEMHSIKGNSWKCSEICLDSSQVPGRLLLCFYLTQDSCKKHRNHWRALATDEDRRGRRLFNIGFNPDTKTEYYILKAPSKDNGRRTRTLKSRFRTIVFPEPKLKQLLNVHHALKFWGYMSKPPSCGSLCLSARSREC